MVCSIGVLGRAWRQWRPTGPKLCCWYHDGSWHDASEIAIGLVEEVTASEHAGEDLIDAMREAVRPWPARLDPRSRPESSCRRRARLHRQHGRPARGRAVRRRLHRALAMMQQGVRRTVTMRLKLLDPDTGDLVLG
ncbi:hypothetical protein [Stackebrandtia soli]|uniref:hypothetical protein n=1 Tax=Stackebrandtia soli TaxID=1892856 RepID=UPI0039EA431B